MKSKTDLFKNCFLIGLFISNMALASDFIHPPPQLPPPPPPQPQPAPREEPKPTASQSSSDESKKIVNNVNEEKVTGKKSLIPDFPGQVGKSGGLIEFAPPIRKDSDSKGCQ